MENHYADIDSIGDGWNDNEAAMDIWNNHIAPVLERHQKELDYETGASEDLTVSAGNGMAAYAHDWAWSEFCDRAAGDNEDAAIELADELDRKLSE